MVEDYSGGLDHDSLFKLNSTINRIPYVSDEVNYGVLDHWATPDQLFEHGGDCEDFAIAKFLILKDYGARLAVTKLKRTDVWHMVVIYNGMVLDNITNEILSVEERSKDMVFAFELDERNLFINGKIVKNSYPFFMDNKELF